jgi:calcineurin-like phosphoesterase family protein
MSTWFTADLHLGHPGILKHQPERAEIGDIKAMDAVLIDGINSVVMPNDDLWILGDVVWQASRAGHYRQRIKCRKIHVLLGNHDSTSLRKHVSTLELMSYRKFEGQKFHLMHYPCASWHGRSHGSIHLYGHSHGSIEKTLDTMWPTRRSQDVGMDHAIRVLGEWRPFSLEEIFERFPPVDWNKYAI